MTVAATLHLRRGSGWLIAASLGAIGLATLTPQPSGATLPHYCLICGSFGTVDAILNVLLFVPLGVGLAGFRVRARNALLFVAALSVAIELTQLAIAGRDSTIGDVVFNTLGGALGFAIAARFHNLIAPGQRTAARLTFAAASLWIVLQCISCLAFKVLVTRAQYFVQVA